MKSDDLLGLLQGVKRTSRGWSTRCPSHSDKSPSLSIREAEDGRILLHCFAGCTPEEICAALSVKVRDLFPDAGQSPAHIRTARQQRHQREQVRLTTRRIDDARSDIFREAERVIAAGSPIPVSSFSVEQSDRFMEALGDAHHAMRLEMGEQDYAEWSSRLGTDHRTLAVG